MFGRKQLRTLIEVGLTITAILPSFLIGAECNVTISAFDPQGIPVGISYVDISIADDASRSVKLSVVSKRNAKHPNSYILLFPQDVSGVHFMVKSRMANGEMQSDRVVMLTCKDSVSIVVGQNNGTDHTTITRVDGQLVECSCKSELWIRAFPMFGGTFAPSFSEAVVAQGTCKFDMAIPNRGVRYIFVVGTGKESLGTFDRNMLGSGVNQLGKVQTSSRLCP